MRCFLHLRAVVLKCINFNPHTHTQKRRTLKTTWMLSYVFTLIRIFSASPSCAFSLRLRFLSAAIDPFPSIVCRHKHKQRKQKREGGNEHGNVPSRQFHLGLPYPAGGIHEDQCCGREKGKTISLVSLTLSGVSSGLMRLPLKSKRKSAVWAPTRAQ